MTNDDILACAQTVQAWGFARDQRRWDDLRDTFHPHGVIHVSWFSGSFETFVEHCMANASGGAFSKHLLWPSRVRGAGTRAISETTTAILVRQVIEDVTVDLTSYARFLDRFEKRNNVWRIVERTCIYEFDRLDPLTPSEKFAVLDEKRRAGALPGALSLHGLSHRRRRPRARRAGASRRPAGDRGAEIALRGLDAGIDPAAVIGLPDVASLIGLRFGGVFLVSL